MNHEKTFGQMLEGIKHIGHFENGQLVCQDDCPNTTHIKTADTSSTPPPTPLSEATGTFCDRCDMEVTKDNWEEHYHAKEATGTERPMTEGEAELARGLDELFMDEEVPQPPETLQFISDILTEK